MSNISSGNSFERRLCDKLADKGFWVHRLNANAHGQPADIIAVKNGNAFLIDAKVCSTNRGFVFSRIEDNQEYAMSLWKHRGNGHGWFALESDDGIYFFTLETLTTARQFSKSLKPNEILKGIPLEKWINDYGNKSIK